LYFRPYPQIDPRPQRLSTFAADLEVWLTRGLPFRYDKSAYWQAKAEGHKQGHSCYVREARPKGISGCSPGLYNENSLASLIKAKIISPLKAENKRLLNTLQECKREIVKLTNQREDIKEEIATLEKLLIQKREEKAKEVPPVVEEKVVEKIKKEIVPPKFDITKILPLLLVGGIIATRRKK